jgi:hypothetical protein
MAMKREFVVFWVVKPCSVWFSAILEDQKTKNSIKYFVFLFHHNMKENNLERNLTHVFTESHYVI